MRAPQIKLFNTLSGKKEALPKPENGVMRLFVCGPTVYDYSHIGHARTYIVFDTLARYLRSLKIKTQYLQNITNIDDKIINRAAELSCDPLELASKYEGEYMTDMKALNIFSVDIYARATDHLKNIFSQINRLMEKGVAYQTDNGIYFEVKKFRSYGKLSRQNLAATRPGWRIEPDPKKKDPLDFALWKFTPPTSGELCFDSPWGKGRPGWHIEDTAIAEKYLGLSYELHGGGMDLKFPHHEAEIAQARTLSGKNYFVKVWMHTGFLTVGGEKMGKSLNNFLTVRDILKKFTAESLRLLILGHHYRTPFDFNNDVLTEAEDAWWNILRTISKLEKLGKARASKKDKVISISSSAMAEFEKNFATAMADDFNTPLAIASIYEFLGSIHKDIWKLSGPSARNAREAIVSKFETLGFKIQIPAIPARIKQLAETREKYRKKGYFADADRIRKQLSTLGYSIEDTPKGPFVWPEVKV